MAQPFTVNAFGIPVGPPQRGPQSNAQNLPGAFPNQTTPLLHSTASHPSYLIAPLSGAAAGGNGGGAAAAPGSHLASLGRFIFSDPMNLLLLALPLGLLSGRLEWGPVTTFFLNFCALIPLAKLLGESTEEMALYTGATLGGLMNATLGNLVELLVSLAALRAGLTGVVQASLLGSVLSNLLLVLGFSFFCGGLRFSEQTFNVTAAQTSASLLSMAVAGFVLPAAFVTAFSGTATEGGVPQLLLDLSRGTALKTHKQLYDAEDDSEQHVIPRLTFPVIIVLLILVSVAVSASAEYLVGSIEGLSTAWNLSETFLGLVVIPIVGNAAEHVTAVTVALKNKMDLTISVAVGSSIQICLFVTPFCVLAGWILNTPMSMAFGLFETAVVFVAVFVVNSLIADGKSNWLEGAMLLALYTIISIA
ncbi:hypothetical protein HK101_002650, partial [Irineochytrium annulatum]